MTDSDCDRRHEIALFRYGLIADLVRLEPGSKGLYALIAQKAAGEYAIPGSTRTRVAEETIRDWLKCYRRGGFEALLPKPRADRGQSRSLPPEVADALLDVKEGNLALSVQLIIREARKRPEVPEDLPLPNSTVHRLLSRHGLMEKPRGEDTDADRRRFAFQHAGELWMSDVMHGPSVFLKGRTKRKTSLIGFLDDATRVSPYADFALAENTRAFLPVLKQAILRCGLPVVCRGIWDRCLTAIGTGKRRKIGRICRGDRPSVSSVQRDLARGLVASWGTGGVDGREFRARRAGRWGVRR
jgi:transposase